MFSEGPPLTKTKPSSGPDPPERAKDSLRLVSFDPGKAGFALKLGDGKKTPASEQLRVTKISHEGQAYWRGVKRDWVIKEVNGDGIEKDSRTLTFSGTIKKRLKEAANCGKKYTVTFILPPEDAKHRARRSVSIPLGSRVKKVLQEESAAAAAMDNFTFAAKDEEENKETEGAPEEAALMGADGKPLQIPQAAVAAEEESGA